MDEVSEAAERELLAFVRKWQDAHDVRPSALVSALRKVIDVVKPTPPQPAADTNPNVARIYLMAQRKAWHHDVPDDWKEVAWERFDYVECGIYEKPLADLTENDRQNWVAYHSQEPEGWIEPSPKRTTH